MHIFVITPVMPMQHLEKGTYTQVNELPTVIYELLEEAINAYQYSLNSAWNDAAHCVDYIPGFKHVSILEWSMDQLTRTIINYMTFLVRRGETDPALRFDPNRLVSDSAWMTVLVLRGDYAVHHLAIFLEFLTDDLEDLKSWCTGRCSGVPDFLEERVAMFEGRFHLEYGRAKTCLVYQKDYEVYKSLY
ncbi:hypothetical protein EDC01DRAFT_777382 [Geopyxis carbonaria]|nr:hypothetical protein EDC01DRAFT_777382 [Geopyxis carbonaria]